MKQRNGGKIFKFIESDKVRIQSTLGKELKRVLVDLQFLNDYYDILDYTSVGYKFVCSYEKQYVQNMEGQPQKQNYNNQVYVSSKGKGLRVEKKQPTCSLPSAGDCSNIILGAQRSNHKKQVNSKTI